MDTTPTEPLVGQVLDGRYRVEARLARGGMATVYTALDLRLDRRVAVKVMHAQFADDPEFVARFIREARSAARLSHPNVVSVFDQGTEGLSVFLVMEYVQGRTLRALLRERGRLTPGQALSLLEPVLAALAAAHDAGIVHRDVKPENVLLADDGRVKVADFGLARAAAVSSQTTGFLIGTAAYLAPEQVVRSAADARTDVYAAGVMLFEMLTGTQPFTGDSPLAVAFRHVHEDVPAPSSRVPGLPAELDSLVRRAAARDPGARPVDARDLMREVRRTMAGLGDTSVSNTTVLAGPPEHHTLVLPSSTEPQPSGSPQVGAPRVGAPPVGAPPPAAALPAQQSRRKPPESARKGRRRWGLVVALLVVATVAAAVAGWWFAIGRSEALPSVLGMSKNAAMTRLAKSHLHARFGADQWSDTVQAGLVVSESPKPPGSVHPGSTVVLALSKGPEQYAVPNVEQDSWNDAATAVLASHLRPQPKYSYSDSVPKGKVISLDPGPGTELRPGSLVMVEVSNGPQPVPVPNEQGRSKDDALHALAAFHVVVTQAYSDTVASGNVISQSPSSGTRPKGSTINVVVSKGPQLFAVPDVRGKSVDDAKQILTDAGFNYRIIQLPFGPGHVLLQSPGAGSMKPHGTTITLEVF